MSVYLTISLTNKLEEGVLFLAQGGLSEKFTTLKPLVRPIEQQIFSRIAGLFISPMAACEIALHTVGIPLSLIASLARIGVPRDIHESLIYMHIQRIQDAVFPLLMGSLMGVIHPYLGSYATEPARKHIGAGILLSGTKKDRFDTVCSPITTMRESLLLLSEIEEPLKISQGEKELLEQVQYWENEFEKIQSIDFFHLNFTSMLGQRLQKVIEAQELPLIIAEVAKRVALVTYPLFALLDLSSLSFTNIISLSAWTVQKLGGHSPAYLEAASSPQVIICNIVKLPLFIVSATIGFVCAMVHPKTGLLCTKYPFDWMTRILFELKMKGLQKGLHSLKEGSQMLIPAVQGFSSGDDLPLVPSYGSHMRYLLVEKKSGGTYEAELIERGPFHGKTAPLTYDSMAQILKNTLSLRYQFGKHQHKVLNNYNSSVKTLDLGTQTGINNCVLTNLFGAIQVLHEREERTDFNELCQQLKVHALRRYQVYGADFYPMGMGDEVLDEIEAIFHQKI